MSDGTEWESATSLQSWIYGARSTLFNDSVLNPGNANLKIAKSQYLSDTRLDFSLKSRDMDLVLKPRLFGKIRRGVGGESSTIDGYFSQAFWRLRVVSGFTLTAGRELLSWGPANFRSPSSPYYYDSGKARPLADVPGVDVARFDWSSGRWTYTGGYVQGGRKDDDDWRHSLVLKATYRGESFLIGGVLNKPRERNLFVGSYAQLSPGEAWLVYGEVASTPVLASTGDAGVTTSNRTQKRSRSTVGTLGASYTFERGIVLSAEYLHDNRGYTRDAEAAHFSGLAERASTGLPATNASTGDGQAPLIGRDYLYLLLQSNLQDTSIYWRASWAVNVQDRSQQFLLYGE